MIDKTTGYWKLKILWRLLSSVLRLGSIELWVWGVHRYAKKTKRGQFL